MRFDSHQLAFIDEAQARSLERVTIAHGDVLLNITGASVARCCLAPRQVVGGRVNQHVMILRINEEKADSGWIGRALAGPYKSNLLAIAGSGATREALTKTDVSQFRLSIPPLGIQRKQVYILQALDDLIENNRRRIEILEEMARLLYREWFVHFRFPGYEGIELVDSDLGPIPEGWQIAKLSHLVSTQYGYTETACSEPVGPRYLRGMDINKNSFIDWSTVPYCPISGIDHQKFAIQVDDVFVIRMADPGKVGICERPVDAVFASYLVRLRPSDGRITPYYLYFTLSDEAYQSWVTGASTGATRKSVSAKVMTEPNVAVPPIDILEQFDKTVRQARSLMNNLLEQNAVLRKARDLLLPRLISGEIDVSELDLDLESSET
ncbi:MAG: restriction endonuclease subunit S [bacterium]|nr:restriction endonuclease subunit S [bacterium]